jgi:7-keto-8-aminopelargonate synthetase-like enzyme
MPSFEDVLQAVDDAITYGVERDMMHNVAEDDSLDGRKISIGGRELVNFGSCSYLGLETHPDLKAGVVDAVQRYGTQFSSSRAYISAPAYATAETLLAELFGRPVIVAPSTTMGHVAALPTLLGARDALLMDHQVHHSVQTAAKLVRGQGTTVELLPHSDMHNLEQRIVELARTHHRIWYAADGLYSMYADFVPTGELTTLMARHEQLWLYIDDAHSVSWTGRHGRGHALERLGQDTLRRCVVAGSLNKSFAAAGGVLTFPDAEMRRRVFTVGGPLIFSGPVQPPMLGAIRASARIHLSPEIRNLQVRLVKLIKLFNRLAADHGLPLVSPSEAPIRCIGAGAPEVAYNLTARLRDLGFFTDSAVFPAVSPKRCGARITITTHHTETDIGAIVDALAVSLPRALADEGSSPDHLRQAFARQLAGRPVFVGAPDGRRADRPSLVLEHHTSVSTVQATEWDAMFGGRGAMDWRGLRTLEDVFATGNHTGNHTANAEDHWRFDYWIIRDRKHGRPVAATFFTTVLWKDDMLSSAELSAAVEKLRAADPYHLTSTIVMMGTLLTEGDHLYVDRDADWRAALRLLLQDVRATEERTGAAGITLRDLPDDPELHDFLLAEGFVRMPVPTSWHREIDFASDGEFLASLTSRPRHHQRTKVLAFEGAYRVGVTRGGEDSYDGDVDHLYGLYRNVHRHSLELNVFPLPRRTLDAVLRHPGWELVTLHLHDGPDRPVAFVAQHIGPRHVQPLFLGLDYDYVTSHGAYQQALWQAVRSAQRLGVHNVLFGMSAHKHKARFGARPTRQWAYVQLTDTYHADVLAQLAHTLSLPG